MPVMYQVKNMKRLYSGWKKLSTKYFLRLMTLLVIFKKHSLSK